tara:strand:- start:659 stop:1471 length:813 start_codon:yes stop_codon:yes gene_type:complete
VTNNYDNPSKYFNGPRYKKKQLEYWIYGINPVIAAIKNKSRVCKQLLCTKDIITKHSKNLHDLAINREIPLEVVSKKHISSKLEPNSRHQGVILRVKSLQEKKIDLNSNNFSQNPILLALDQINDPQNVGAIIRSSLVMGCDGVIITKKHSPQETGLLAKAAAGALEFINIYRVTNLTRTLNDLKKNKFWVLGCEVGGASQLKNMNISGPLVIVVGSEGKGLRPLTKKVCDASIAIDVSKKALKAGVDSLNVASATSVALYAINQLRKIS